MTAPSLLAHLVAAGLIGGGFWLVGAWAGGAANAALTRAEVDPALRLAVTRAALPVIFGLGLLAALSALGIDPRGLLVVLATLGLGAGLALKGPLSALAGGVVLLITRPFAVGDQIDVRGVGGRVSAMGLLVTTVETPEGDRISVRNDRVWGGPLRVRPSGQGGETP